MTVTTLSSVTTADVYNFKASPNLVNDGTQYTSLSLTWNDITLGGINPYTSVAVNRSGTGPPADISDGVSIVKTASDSQFTDAFSDSFGGSFGSLTSAIDTGLNSGQWYYYSLFGYNGTNWIKLDETAGLVPTKYAYQDQLMSWTPGVYKNAEQEVSGRSDPSSSQLYSFYGILGYVADYTRTYVETLNNAYDTRSVSAAMLPWLCDEFGITYEKEAGAARNRALAADAIDIWQAKGNPIGLETFITDLSGYSTQLIDSKNLLLDYNDYNFNDFFVKGIASNLLNTVRWKRTVGNSVTSISLTPMTAPSLTNAAASVPAITLSTSGNATNFDQIFQYYINSSYSGTTGVVGPTETNAIVSGSSNVLQNAIPIPANDVYLASCYAGMTISTGTARFRWSCQWYDQYGKYLSVSTGTTQTYTVSGSTQWIEQAFYPPTGAAYAMPMFLIGGTVGVAWTITNFFFGQTGIRDNAVTGVNNVPFAPNTQLINVNPTRRNRIYCPDFVTGWASGAPVSSPYNVETNGSMQWSTGGVGTATVAQSTTDLTKVARVQRNRKYTYSVWARYDTGTVTQYQIQITWYGGPNLATDALYTTTKTFTPAVTQTWQQLAVTDYAPNTAQYATVSMTATTSAASTGWYNGPLFEDSPVVLPYFGGTVSSFVGASTDIRTSNTYNAPVSGTQSAYQAMTNYYRRHDTFLAGSGGTPGRIAANLDDTVTQGKNILLPVGALYQIIEYPDVEEIGSVYWRNNLWLYDCTHSWYNGLAECWGTDDIWTSLWGDLLNRSSSNMDWADEMYLSWDYESVGFYTDVYADLYS